MTSQLNEQLRKEAELLLKQTEDGLHDCADFLGCSPDTLRSLILEGKPWGIKDLWASKCLRESMLEITAKAKGREDLTIMSVVDHAKNKENETAIGALYDQRFRRLLGQEWRAISFSLPTRRDALTQPARAAVLALLEEKVQANASINELTKERLISEANVNVPTRWLKGGDWLGRPLRAAIRLLKVVQQDQVKEPPAGLKIVPIPGG